MAKQKVLFLCTGNSARSQIAEAFLRQHGGEHYEVFSAGLEPKGINPFTIRVMDEINVDVRGQSSDAMRDMDGPFDYVITVCGHADEHCPAPLWQGGVKLHWPFEDPAAVTGDDSTIMTAFRQTRDQMEAQVQRWISENSPAG
jgi:arsenate reductase (thioredoxin)